MKKFSAILLAFIVLSLAIVPTTAFAAEEKAFWVSHFNDGTSEGAGAIFTEVDSAGGWWIHVAFAPVDGVENTYEIVEISDGIAAGNGVALTVPEGGFVWAANTGNDYITLGIGDTDFTSPNCSNAIADAQTWVVGDKLTFNGLDLTGVIPTTTPDIRWYDDAYVCTATYTLYEGDASSNTSSDDVASSEAPAVSDDDATSSEAATSETASEEVSVASTASAASDASESEDGDNTTLWIIIAVVGVVVVAAVVVVVLKKKK